jgi:hypothetical protein
MGGDGRGRGGKDGDGRARAGMRGEGQMGALDAFGNRFGLIYNPHFGK